jgi:hypothetical protein
MCPACISVATWWILGSTSASALLAGAALKLRPVAAQQATAPVAARHRPWARPYEHRLPLVENE